MPLKDKAKYHVPIPNKFARILLRPMARTVFRFLSVLTFTGLENIPPRGPYIVALNHISLFDAPFIVAFWPSELEAMIASDVWSRKGQNVIINLYYGIQVHRSEFDRTLIDKVLAVLESGKPILIAPEGTRSHKPGMQRAFPGIGYIIEKAQVPVVPVGITGAFDDFLDKAIHFKHPRLEMHIGKPIYLPVNTAKGEERRKQRQQTADTVMVKIGELLPPEYRGVYRDFQLPITRDEGNLYQEIAPPKGALL